MDNQVSEVCGLLCDILTVRLQTVKRAREEPTTPDKQAKRLACSPASPSKNSDNIAAVKRPPVAKNLFSYFTASTKSVQQPVASSSRIAEPTPPESATVGHDKQWWDDAANKVHDEVPALPVADLKKGLRLCKKVYTDRAARKEAFAEKWDAALFVGAYRVEQRLPIIDEIRQIALCKSRLFFSQ